MAPASLQLCHSEHVQRAPELLARPQDHLCYAAQPKQPFTLGALRSWAAFAGLLVLAQFSFRIERFAAHFTLVLTGLLVHDCSS